MIDEILFEAFKKTVIDWIVNNHGDPYYIESDHKKDTLICKVLDLSDDKPTSFYEKDTIECWVVHFDFSKDYHVKLQNQYVTTKTCITRIDGSWPNYLIKFEDISVDEQGMFIPKLSDITYKPHSMKECVGYFSDLLKRKYYQPNVNTAMINTDDYSFIVEVDSGLIPITNYVTIKNPRSDPRFEFTFKRINIEKQPNITLTHSTLCTYILVKGKKTLSELKTIKYKDRTFDVIDYSESDYVNGFELRESDNNTSDPVNHPNHYEMVGPFESFDIIVESLGIEGARYFCQGNVIKYQTRYKEKNGEEDLKKRHWYSRMDQMLAKCKTIEDYYKLKESDF